MKEERNENIEFIPVELHRMTVEEYEAMDGELCIASAD